MKQKKIIFALLFFSALQVFFIPVTGAAGGKGSVAINLSTVPLSVDPITVIGESEKTLLYNLHEGLVRWENGLLTPAAAQKWTVSADGLTYTFFLQKRYWSNGEPVTAYDFEKSWKRLIQTGHENQTEFITDIIYNAKEYRTKELSSIDQVGIRSLDHERLEVKLAQPSGYFLSLLSQPRFFPVHSEYSTGRKDDQEYAPGFCSNGPFFLKEWNLRDYAILAPNKYYSGQAPQVEQVKLTFLSAETALSLYAAGLIDLLESPPVSAFPKFEKDVLDIPMMSTRYLYLNLRRSPLNNYLVRKALSLAIQRDLLLSKTPTLAALPATGFIPLGISDSKSDSDFRRSGGELLGPSDGQQALNLLYSAGYPGEDGLPEIDLLVVEDPEREAMAKVIADMWRVNLGFKVKVKAVNWQEFEELCSTGRFYIASAEWEGNYPDPMTFLRLFHSEAEENFSGYKNTEYDQWLSLAEMTKDPFEKYRIYHKLEEKLLGDLPVIPLYFSTRRLLVSQNIEGLRFSGEGFPLFHGVRRLGN